MSKSTTASDRQQRLAAKLKENLKRRKAQAKARSQTGATADQGEKTSSAAQKPDGK